MAQSWAVATSATQAAIKSFGEVMAAELNHVVALTASTDTEFIEIGVFGACTEIIGFWKQMGDYMALSLADALSSMDAAVHSF